LVDHQLDDGGIGRGVTTTEHQRARISKMLKRM
jgi:hypothetical protein